MVEDLLVGWIVEEGEMVWQGRPVTLLILSRTGERGEECRTFAAKEKIDC